VNLFKKNFYSFIYFIAKFFFILLILVSIFRFKKKLLKKFKNKYFSVPTVNTYGDIIDHLELTRLLEIDKKKNFIFISANEFPNNYFPKIFLNKEKVIFYKEGVYNFFLNILKKIPSKHGYLVRNFNHLLQQYLIKYLASFKFYEDCKDFKLNKKISTRGFSQEFINSYLAKIHLGKSFSTSKLWELKKKYGSLNLTNLKDVYDERYKNLLFKRLGIKKKFVCFHIRTSWTHKLNKFEPRDVSIDNLDSFNSSLIFLTKNGYEVVLMGLENKQLKNYFNFKGVIDYRNSGYQNLKNDLYLYGLCDFFMGQVSGPFVLAMHLDRPILLMDVVSIDDIPCVDKILFYPKKIVKKNLKQLRMREFINLPLYYGDEFVNQNLYFLKDMSERERLACVKEFLGKISSNNFSFKSKLHKKLKSMLHPTFHKNFLLTYDKVSQDFLTNYYR
jgi:putative glycosyltransferase (TIGR04372 family)